jgi:hypothetical protein
MSNTGALALISTKAGLAAVASIVVCLTLISYGATRISSTEYLGNVVVKDTSPFTVTISQAYATVTDSSGRLVGNIEVSNLPVTLNPGETVSIEVPIHLSAAIEDLSAAYTSTSVFNVDGHVNYSVGWLTTDSNISFQITKAEVEQYNITG